MSSSDIILLVALLAVVAIAIPLLMWRARTWRAMTEQRQMLSGRMTSTSQEDAASGPDGEGPDGEGPDGEGPKRRLLSQDIAVEIPLTVLLAEDTQVNQVLIERIFAQMGYSIAIVDNGRSAVERARDERFDLILMDIQMPEMDGIEACRRILEESRVRADAPPVIIAVTANASPENRELCLEAGMRDFIPKPFTLEVLQRVVARMGERA